MLLSHHHPILICAGKAVGATTLSTVTFSYESMMTSKVILNVLPFIFLCLVSWREAVMETPKGLRSKGWFLVSPSMQVTESDKLQPIKTQM